MMCWQWLLHLRTMFESWFVLTNIVPLQSVKGDIMKKRVKWSRSYYCWVLGCEFNATTSFTADNNSWYNNSGAIPSDNFSIGFWGRFQDCSKTVSKWLYIDHKYWKPPEKSTYCRFIDYTENVLKILMNYFERCYTNVFLLY